MTTQARGALSVFGLVLGIHLVAQLLGADALARWSQWLLVPPLGVAVAATLRAAPARHARLLRLVLVGLGFSWLGDTLPHLVGEAGFLVLVGMFAVAQAAYAAAFWPDQRRSLLRTPWALVYVAVAALLLTLCLPHAGTVAPAVTGYAALITLMAVLATGVHRLAAVGAALFVLSDSLIALEAFVPAWEVPGQGFWVMSTYGLAQLLIVLGVLRRLEEEPGPGAC